MADSAHVDPVFEGIEAPKYIDFANNVDNDAEDAWFDDQREDEEELKASDLLDGDNEEDFGTSNMDSYNELPQLKRSIRKSIGKRSSKKSRLNNSSRVLTHSALMSSLTVPKSPCFATNYRLRGTALESEEDMQTRYIASMAVEQSKRRRLNSFYKKKALYGSAGYLPIRSTKPLTEPEEVHFHTDERKRCMTPEEEPVHEVVIEKTESGLTIPRPFQFYTETRVKPDAPQPPKSPYVSFKQKMIQLQKKTPKRFRTLPRNRQLWKLSPPPAHKGGITIPHGFSFETEERARPTHVMSAEEREALEMENIPKFKALPLDLKVLNSGGQLGISRAPKQPLTEPKTPKLSTVERASKREVVVEEEEFHMFKARDFDRSIFAVPKGVPQLPHKGVTIPESPCLATKTRSIFHPPPAVPKEEPFVFKARPIPIVEPFVPAKSQEHKLQVQPFSLTTEERGKKARTSFQEKVFRQKRRERQMKNFKAQPMPIADPPEPKGFVFAPPPTIPQPFVLKSEIRGEQHQSKFQRQMEEEEREKKVQAAFKANPIPDAPPFQPHRSDKPLTVITDFALNSDLRSAQRQRFEQHKTEKSKAAEEARRLQEEARKMEEEKFIKQMRKKLVHKPMPILPGKQIHIQPSSQPLTDPHTPHLRTRQRSAVHSGRDL